MRRYSSDSGRLPGHSGKSTFEDFVQIRTQHHTFLDRLESIPDRIDVCAWRLGDLTLIGFPGELFASLGGELTRSRTPALLLGYTNGYLGYFPDRHAYDTGTYEALSSPYAPGASEELVAWMRSQW